MLIGQQPHFSDEENGILIGLQLRNYVMFLYIGSIRLQIHKDRMSQQKQSTTFPFITLITEAKNNRQLHRIKIAGKNALC